MLFTSYTFLLLFLPLTCAIFYILCVSTTARAAASWLALMSLVFYGYWSPKYVVLLLASIGFNFLAGKTLLWCRENRADLWSRRVVVGAISINLIALCYYKYTNFFLAALSDIAGLHWQIANIVLPIGISFFTFTQIAFLVDTYQGKVREARFIPYVLFVSYFPHLIAGPVLHHSEMMPQFEKKETFRFQLNNMVSGVTLLAIGLFKKICLADGIQPFVAPVFDSGTADLTGLEAWGGALSYAMQLYFDFSGYSDMAIGLSRMFNVELPLNFSSPYKASNIAEFWRRWHMTLSRFLRDYLYIPLGGNRRGSFRRYVNLMLTMLLGGLWHGAGWTFLAWGALHGLYLAVNQAWNTLLDRMQSMRFMFRWMSSRLFSVPTTFVFVTIAWVFFRADSMESGLDIVSAMFGANGWTLPMEWQQALVSIFGPGADLLHFDSLAAFAGFRQVVWIVALLLLVWFFPNSQQIMAIAGKHAKRCPPHFLGWAALGALFVAIMMLAMINFSHGNSEFIYFNF